MFQFNPDVDLTILLLLIFKDPKEKVGELFERVGRHEFQLLTQIFELTAHRHRISSRFSFDAVFTKCSSTTFSILYFLQDV